MQKAYQKIEARLVPSAATHHRSRNETVHTGSLNVYLKLYEARQGRGEAIVKRRKRVR